MMIMTETQTKLPEVGQLLNEISFTEDDPLENAVVFSPHKAGIKIRPRSEHRRLVALTAVVWDCTLLCVADTLLMLK